ncbi:MAG: DUF1553 domain-containing protein [Verrucomicrobia bacterium]|nr:DUF1553 domain-containing protein [Verrucomicrobiota bacterium]
MRAFCMILAVLLMDRSSAFASTLAPDYSREIRPILADHCFACHGPDEKARKGGLRLDLRDDALHGGKSDGPAIVPGHPEKSALLQRILTTDTDDVMPPTGEKHPVKSQHTELLRRWIAAGAPYSKHWAFESPIKSPLPSRLKQNSSAAIDHFVQARLAKAGLRPSPAASPEQMARRLYLDLIGLPPSPAETARFVSEARKNLGTAVESLADRLLASEHFGEKWARQWLDAARYADSNGYEKDLMREQWAWRDWVIQAYNRDLPYPQFIVEQIAGDLLPGRTQDQLIATGFFRNGMINEEGAIVPEEFRMEGNFDRMDTLGKSVLGLTLQCAQCHSHKFDPISHEEYYGLFSFINNSYDAQSRVYNSEQQERIAKLQATLDDVDRRVRESRPHWAAELDAWGKQVLDTSDRYDWKVIEAEDLHSTSELNHPTTLPDGSILTLGHRTVSGDVYMIAQPAMENITGLRLEIFTHGDLPYDGPGRSFLGTWALSELIVEAKRPGSNQWTALRLAQATADFSEPDGSMEPEWSNKSLDKDGKRRRGPVAYLIDTNDLTGWRADRGRGRRHTESVAVVQFETPQTLPRGTKLKFSLRMNHGGDNNGDKNTMVGRFRLSTTTHPHPSAPPVDYAAILALRVPEARRTDKQRRTLFAAWRHSVPALKSFNEEAEAAWKPYPDPVTSILHLAERGPEDPRETRRLDRGQWNRPKETVRPQVPAVLHPIEPGNLPRRLAFAQWLVDQRSPLAARVAVNRVWQALFGRGLVETSEDFGLRGAEPSHPELLDWLAVDFMEKGWSHKQLIRGIVTSATYRQSSRVTPEQQEKDPGNQWLARGPRFRAEAEVIRDIALAASGLLSPCIGGPSIFPPVPQNVLDFNFFGMDYWIPAQGPERYRRSLYVFRKRSMPDPALSTFDAPNADTSCARRPRSNTPLAALASLNEPVFVEASQALALRILREGGATDARRADYAYQLCVGRAPRPSEKQALLELLDSRRKKISEGWLNANELATGDPSRRASLPEKTTPRDAAAWAVASRVLLNLDETLTKH